MSAEAEITAMGQLAAALTPLDEAARRRTLQWAVAHFLMSGTAAPQLNFGPQIASAAGVTTNAPSNFESFADLFEIAAPSTEREKALVAAYWVQVNLAQPSFGSQPLNDALKDLGHGVGNITDALTALKEERPALILQLKKSGASKQARKTYKLTQEGIRRAQEMLSKVATEDERR